MNDESKRVLSGVEFSRRGFVVTSLATGFAVATQPISAQTIGTDTKGLEAGEVKIPVTDGEIPAYRAMPEAGGPFPTVLVVQEIFGVHEHIKDICRRLAKLGYLAVAPELYARQGDVSKIDNIRDIISKVVSKVPDAQVHVRPGRRGGLGQGLEQGGHGAAGHHRILLGRADRLALRRPQPGPEGRRGLVRPAGRRAGRAAPEEPDRPGPRAQGACPRAVRRCRPGNPGRERRADARALKEAGKTDEIIVYPETPHAFFADYRPSYRKDQAADGWKRLLELFKQHGVA